MKFLLLLVWTGCLFATDLTGTWTGRFESQRGELQDITFKFVQNGANLTGKLYGDNESTPIANGKVEAGELTFSTAGRPSFKYRCVLKGDEIEVTRIRDGQQGERPNPRLVFRLKRLF